MRTDPSRLEWDRLRSGLALLAGIALVATAVFFLDEVQRELSEGPTLHVATPEARKLEPGAAVWVAGVPAGRVLSIGFRQPAPGAEGHVLVRAVLHEDAADLLRADATAEVRESALLAPSVVALRPGTAPTPFDFSDTLVAVSRVSPADVLASADSLARRLGELRPLSARLRERLEDGPGTLAALRADSSLRAELAGSAAGLRRLSEEAGTGTAALLAGDSTLASRWGRIRARGDTLASVLPSGAIGRLAAALDSLGRRTAVLEARLEDARGSAGRFLNDAAVEREFRELEARIAALKAELMRDPLAWLRFQLF